MPVPSRLSIVADRVIWRWLFAPPPLRNIGLARFNPVKLDEVWRSIIGHRFWRASRVLRQRAKDYVCSGHRKDNAMMASVLDLHEELERERVRCS